MTPLLTTITPCWGRKEMLEGWLKSICANAVPEVVHLLIYVGYPPNEVLAHSCENLRIRSLLDSPPQSIGFYHNWGAQIAETDWIMKMDVDCIAHVEYFKVLVEVLKKANGRQWFNGGMYYLGPRSSVEPPVSVVDYHCHRYSTLGGTNFICGRQDYLKLGGCDERFKGWGWEDYQQIYMLERHQQGTCPLPGVVDERNVTRRCRDEISRRKASELIAINNRLGLLHCWHPPSNDASYKNQNQSDENKKVLLDYIVESRLKPLAKEVANALRR